MIVDDFPTSFNTYWLDQIAQGHVQFHFEIYSRDRDFTTSLGNLFRCWHPHNTQVFFCV